MSAAYCPLCNVILEDNKCPSCSAVYHPESEIMKYSDIVSFSHEDENPELGGVSTSSNALEAADDSQDPGLIDMLKKKDQPNRGYGSDGWD